MNNQNILVFIIKAQKRVDIPFTNDPKKHPIHEHYLTQVEEMTFVYKYKPDKSLNNENYIEELKHKFKIKYNALSIEVGTLDDYLRLKT